VPFGERAHVRKAGEAHRRAGGFGAARNHDVRIIILNGLERVAHGIGGAGTRGGHGVVRAAQAVADRNVSARGIEHELRNRECGDFVRSLRNEPLVLSFDLGESADARAEDHAAAERFFLGEVDSRIVHGVDAGNQRELREAIDALLLLAIDVAFGRPIVDIAAEAHFVMRGIECSKLVNAAVAAQHLIPEVVDLAAQGGDGANTGDDNTTFHEKAGSRGRGAIENDEARMTNDE
jgi:hypothetical protein